MRIQRVNLMMTSMEYLEFESLLVGMMEISTEGLLILRVTAMDYDLDSQIEKVEASSIFV